MTEFKTFSPKQLKALNWWLPSSPQRDRDAIICDGSVRSGKTLCMSLSFALWAMCCFKDTQFAICGKTVNSLRRNVVSALLPTLKGMGFECREKLSANKIEISLDRTKNTFYLFGGRDESSASLIQGMTLGGVMFDEVALMPRSFVEQALARCSIEGSKYWFNCNPDNPTHWFYTGWIKRAKEKNCLYLHFTMSDNPSLTRKVINRYKSLYSGVFYRRFIEGKWVAAQGLVYPFFDTEKSPAEPPGDCERYCMSVDYGTVNPFSCGLWGLKEGVWYRLEEYYFDSRRTGMNRTDEEHYRAVEALAGNRRIELMTVDPSAASFIECVKRHGRFTVIPAVNDVINGIRKTSQALKDGRIAVCTPCDDCIRELGTYRWKESSSKDAPEKENDHAMDDMRYFVMTLLPGDDIGFFAAAVGR